MVLGDEAAYKGRDFGMLRDAYPSRSVGYDLTGACFRIEAPGGKLTPCWFSVKKIGLSSFFRHHGRGLRSAPAGCWRRWRAASAARVDTCMECWNVPGASCARRRSRGLLISDSSTRVTVEVKLQIFFDYEHEDIGERTSTTALMAKAPMVRHSKWARLPSERSRMAV